MAHHADYVEAFCKHCGKKFYYREIDVVHPDDALYCSDECAARDNFPPGWFNKGAKTKRQRIKKRKY